MLLEEIIPTVIGLVPFLWGVIDLPSLGGGVVGDWVTVGHVGESLLRMKVDSAQSRCVSE
jgi:hypothetical protein